MRQIIVEFGNEKKLNNDFLALPKTLYDKGKCPQDIKTEKQILTGSHVLSDTFKVTPFVAYVKENDNKNVVARALVTSYENDNIAYVGFFESVNDEEVCSKLFDAIFDFVKKDGKKTVTGPVDASFWIRYRFKLSSDRGFEDTYSCEPYNKDYYVKLWEKCGFERNYTYISNFYRKVKPDDISPKLKSRYERMCEKGYILRTSSYKTFDKDLVAIYRLITKTYRHFPMYTDISLQQFVSMFGYLKYVLNYSMVKLLFKDEEAVGFIICVPDFGFDSVGKLTIAKFLRIINKKKNPKEYVILYMGVDGKHLGTGSALAEDIKNELCKNGSTSIGALILEGKVTGLYYSDLFTGKSKYVLLERNL